MTSSWSSDPASFTAASQSLSARYVPEHALPAVNIALPGYSALVPVEQLDAERVVDVPVVVEAPVEALDVLGRHEVQEVLVEVGAHDAARRARVKPASVQLLEERREPGRDDRVEHDLGARRHDVVDDPLVVGVIEREVLLADDLAALRR